uniref:Uncharacterized protein n=1 Tax=Hyaloperonospora arabidopsidis (strain Emoy2) TaxID=559515 RepID=M4BG83_HYAAE
MATPSRRTGKEEVEDVEVDEVEVSKWGATRRKGGKERDLSEPRHRRHAIRCGVVDTGFRDTCWSWSGNHG